MPLTYEIVFKSQGDGGQPTNFSVSDSSQGQPPTTEKPQIPKQPEPPTSPTSTGSNLTQQQVEDMVARASEKAKAEGVQRPEPSPQPQQPAGEATLNAIRAATQRSERSMLDDINRRAIESGVSGESQGKVTLEVPKPDPSTQRPAPKPAEAPQQTTKPEPSVGQPSADDAMKKVNEEAGRRSEEGAAGQPSTPTSQSGDEEFKWPDERKQPGKSEQPMPRPGEMSVDQVQALVSKIVGAAGGAFNVPGAGVAASAIGATGALGLGLAGIGAAGFATNSYRQELEKLGSFSPDIAQAQANADVKETMRLLEQAKKYGEQDAKTYETWNNASRAAWQLLVNRGRRLASGEIFSDFADPFGALSRDIRALRETFDEWNRKTPGPQDPVSRYKESWDHLPPPPPFDSGSTVVMQERKQRDVLTGL